MPSRLKLILRTSGHGGHSPLAGCHWARSYFVLRGLLAFLIFLATFATPRPLLAEQERILSFLSDISIHEDGSLVVTETIEVAALGQEIKRGLVREIPVTYSTPYGQAFNVGFEILSVTRDAHAEPYFTKRAGNNLKIYIGDKDVFLKPGHTTYRLTYRTTDQIGFYDDFDELYWNVTGNDWSFTIERAEARIALPPEAVVLQEAAYSGPAGAQGRDFTVSQEGTTLVYRTSKPLPPGEGLTVAVGWPKGLVREPTWFERYGQSLGNGRQIAVAAGGFCLLLFYYVMVWRRIGRDPAGGPIIPRYRPPQGLSPAAVRYIMEMGYDSKAFSAALVSLAVKGRLTIEKDRKGYRLVSADSQAADLSPGERKLASRLFSKQSSIALEQKNHGTIRAAMNDFRRALDRDYEKDYFRRNRGPVLIGLGLMAVTFVAVGLLSNEWPVALFMCVWLTIWSCGCYGLLRAVFAAWRSLMFAGGFMMLLPALFITGFALPFFCAEVVALYFLGSTIGYLSAVIMIGCMVLVAAFYHWMQAPTEGGRRLMDDIEGFRLYLGVAEEARLEALHPPEETPEVFEKFLPYALALDVENQWCEAFAARAAAAQGAAQGSGTRTAYNPGWYRGRGFNPGDLSSLGRSLGNELAGAASSASRSPSSRSGGGSSGGGSSGGGGGGGGGSGW